MADDFSSLQVDDLLQQLRNTPPAFVVKSTDTPTTELPPVSSAPIKEEELGEYIIQKTSVLVDQTMRAFNDVAKMAGATNDPETITALADLVKSVSGSLDTLNKIHIQNKKAQASKDIALIQAESRRKLLEQQPSTTMNVLAVGTREEVLKMLEQTSKKIQQGQTIDIDPAPEKVSE